MTKLSREELERYNKYQFTTRTTMGSVLVDIKKLMEHIAAVEAEREELKKELGGHRMVYTPKVLMTVRESAVRRLPLSGADAQGLEGALQQVERELSKARAEVDELKDFMGRTASALMVPGGIRYDEMEKYATALRKENERLAREHDYVHDWNNQVIAREQDTRKKLYTLRTAAKDAMEVMENLIVVHEDYCDTKLSSIVCGRCTCGAGDKSKAAISALKKALGKEE